MPPTRPSITTKSVPSMGEDLGLRLVHGSLAPRCPQRKRHPNWLSRFCRAHGCDKQTGRQTHKYMKRPSYSGNNRPSLMLCTAMWPDNIYAASRRNLLIRKPSRNATAILLQCFDSVTSALRIICKYNCIHLHIDDNSSG